MLHNITISADELELIQKRKYAVLKTDLNRVEGDGIVFTIDGTRTQLQAAIADVNTIFKSKQILSLDHMQVSGVEAVDDVTMAFGQADEQGHDD